MLVQHKVADVVAATEAGSKYQQKNHDFHSNLSLLDGRAESSASVVKADGSAQLMAAVGDRYRNNLRDQPKVLKHCEIPLSA